MDTTALTAQRGTIKDIIAGAKFQQALAGVLPKSITAERFARIAIQACNKQPLLLQCDKTSIVGCLMALSALGMEADGRNAHLVPFRRKDGTYAATLILDYKGLVQLAYANPKVTRLHADKVCMEDEFEVDAGKLIKHKVNYKGDRGHPYAYYALVEFESGKHVVSVMTISEVDAVRRRSRSPDAGPWATDFDEMAKKTVFKRLSKWTPISTQLRDAINAEDDHEAQTIDVETTAAEATTSDLLAKKPVQALAEPDAPETLEIQSEQPQAAPVQRKRKAQASAQAPAQAPTGAPNPPLPPAAPQRQAPQPAAPPAPPALAQPTVGATPAQEVDEAAADMFD